MINALFCNEGTDVSILKSLFSTDPESETVEGRGSKLIYMFEFDALIIFLLSFVGDLPSKKVPSYKE